MLNEFSLGMGLPDFYPFVLSPAIAALSMSGSSAVVAINALMLKRTKLAGIHQTGKSAMPGAPGVASPKQSEPIAVAS